MKAVAKLGDEKLVAITRGEWNEKEVISIDFN